MKVWELREKLEKADPDALVVIHRRDASPRDVIRAEIGWQYQSMSENFPAVTLFLGPK